MSQAKVVPVATHCDSQLHEPSNLQTIPWNIEWGPEDMLKRGGKTQEILIEGGMRRMPDFSSDGIPRVLGTNELYSLS